jgi:hypothetical protein
LLALLLLGWILSFRFYSMALLDGVQVCFGAVCKNSGVLMMVKCWSSECCLPWPCSSPLAAGSAGLLWCCQRLTQSV